MRIASIFVAASALALAPAGLTPVEPAHAAPSAHDSGAIADFYRARGGRPLWLGPNSGTAAAQLVQLLSTAQIDGLNPNRYNARGAARALQAARSGNPAAIQRAEAILSTAFVAYARDLKRDPGVGIIYVDPELRPTPMSARALLSQAASASSLPNYVEQMGWMNPIYGRLRQALASRVYMTPREGRLLQLNLERARALPSNGSRYVLLNPPAARLYM